MQLAHDPSVSSYYVNDALYQELVDSFSDWQRDDLAISDSSERDRFRMLIEREARTLGSAPLRRMVGNVFARMHILGARHTARRRPSSRDCDLVRRPPPDGRPNLPPAHGICLVTGAEIAHRPTDIEHRSVRHQSKFGTNGALEFPDQRVPCGRNAVSIRVVRPPLPPECRQLANPGEAGQSDRLRSESSQSQHRHLARQCPSFLANPGRRSCNHDRDRARIRQSFVTSSPRRT